MDCHERALAAATAPYEDDERTVSEDDMAHWLNHGWFAADSVLKSAFLGTIIGFILMLAPIGELTSFDAASLQSALAAMSAGMAVALYTTLAGLIAILSCAFSFKCWPMLCKSA